MRSLLTIFAGVALLTACNNRQSASPDDFSEDKEAKAMLQGVWVEEESGDLAIHVKGDTIFYADSTSMPAYFNIIGDSLLLGSGTKYYIEKRTPHILWFNNQNGDIVKLRKSDDPHDEKEFVHDPPQVLVYTHQVKTDSVVMYGGERFHWYIAINPTKYKVVKRTLNDEGMEVENVYYDNIMHISLYKGAICIYSSNIRKQMYSGKVPDDFLNQAILCNMEYSHIDAKGLYFNATLCIPDGVSCYLVESLVSYDGKMTMSLIE